MATVPNGTTASGQPSRFDSDNPAPDEEIRHTFIGGSEAFELLNERQYGKGCARALGYRKTKTPEDVPSERGSDRAMSMRAVLKRGSLLEDLAAQIYMESTGRSLIKRNRIVRHPDHPGAGVHTDRIILAAKGENPRPTGDAEIKTHGQGPFFNILRNGLPPAHNLQIQWSLFCTQHTWGAFIILGIFGGDEQTGLPLKHFDVERDPALMNIFAHAVDDFWDGLANGVLPPPLPDPADVRCKTCAYRLTCRGEALDPAEYQRLLHERASGRDLKPINDDDLDQALADRALILSEIQALDSDSEKDPGALQLVTERIKERLGDTEAAIVNKHWKVYCAENVWSGLDVQRLRQEEPEIFKRFYIDKRPTGSKRLRVYAIHDGKLPRSAGE